jgi:hypothetical protein
MASDTAGAKGYLHHCLSDGAEAFRYRGRVRALLGFPELTGIRVNFSKPLPVAGFQYVVPRFTGEFEFPDELLPGRPRTMTYSEPIEHSERRTTGNPPERGRPVGQRTPDRESAPQAARPNELSRQSGSPAAPLGETAAAEPDRLKSEPASAPVYSSSVPGEPAAHSPRRVGRVEQTAHPDQFSTGVPPESKKPVERGAPKGKSAAPAQPRGEPAIKKDVTIPESTSAPAGASKGRAAARPDHHSEPVQPQTIGEVNPSLKAYDLVVPSIRAPQDTPPKRDPGLVTSTTEEQQPPSSGRLRRAPERVGREVSPHPAAVGISRHETSPDPSREQRRPYGGGMRTHSETRQAPSADTESSQPRAVPSPQPSVIVVNQGPDPRTNTFAFWERRYLTRPRVRIRR